MGDFNVNLLNAERHTLTSEFCDTMFAYHHVPLITKPTRVTTDSVTLIDNIFTNKFDTDSFHGILYTDITDHCPIFCIHTNTHITNSKGNFQKRVFSIKNMNKFIQRLRAADWCEIMSSNDSQLSFSLFHQQFLKHFDNSFPIEVKKSEYRKRKPWLTLGLKCSIKRKNKLYLWYKKHPSKGNEKIYKTYKSKLAKLIQLAEREHYDRLFETHKSNVKESWKIINTILCRNKVNVKSNKYIINNCVETDKNVIANKFNDFFVHIGPSLADKIPKTNIKPTSFIKSEQKLTNSFFMEPITHNEVEKIIMSLKDSSPGWDSINAKCLKESYQYFIEPLLHCLNLSFKNGEFPKELKVAKVVPIYKSGESQQIKNYRPVSVLSVFSKLFEKIMHNRLAKFLDKNNVLYNYQFGFRKGYSTSLALISLVDKISVALNDGKYMLGMFLDFSKAFDTVNHEILCDKLECYGIRGVALQWFQSYLSNRSQYVMFDGAQSSVESVTCGVPQGSILGPLLFLLYVNDISNVSDLLFTTLFADDTNLFLEGTDIDAMCTTMNSEMEKLCVWLNVNKLSLNVDKTYLVVFTKRQKIEIRVPLKIMNVNVKEVDCAKYLGFYIDAHLNWSYHIKFIKNKIAKGLGIINKAKKVVSAKTLITLYNSFILPYLTYGIEVWGATFDYSLNSLAIVQKKSLRLLASKPKSCHTDPLFKQMKLLTLPQLYTYSINLFMFKFHFKMLPNVFNDMFVYNQLIHDYQTRQYDLLHVPCSKSVVLSKSIRIKGVYCWNSIYKCISTDSSFVCFKRKLKAHLMADDCLAS